MWIAQVLSEFGDWAARIALAVLVERRTGSAVLTGAVTTVSVLPYLGLGQVLATVGDRLPRRTVLVVTDLGRAALFLVLALPVPTAVLFVLAFLAGCLTPPFEAARSALMPATVPRERYGDAIALAQVSFEAALFGGYLLGGGLAALVGPRGALVVNAGSFLVSALVLSFLRAGREPAADAADAPTVAAGVRAILDEPYVRRFVLFFTAVGACAIVGESLAAVYVADELGGGAARVGALAAAVPAGVIITTALLPAKGDDDRLMRTAGALALVGAAIGLAGFVLDLGFPWVMVPFAGLGVVFASRIPANQVAGLRIPDEVRSTAFAVVQGAILGAQGLAAAGGGALADWVGVRQACAIALVPAVVLGAGAATVAPRPRPKHGRKLVGASTRRR
jgi:predicted MFS family arabinose efflux permease